ncbi:MAG: zinc-binding protein [Rubrivivax sp.]|nr:MAG: zinc-binding protein [Rubrivivax sp.]
MMDEQYAIRVDDVKARAHGRWDEILRHLGVDDAVLSRKNMACPLCGGTDRFQYTDRFGEGNYHCRNPDCGPGGGFKLLQAVMGWDFGTALRKVHDCVGGLPAGSWNGSRVDCAGRRRPHGDGPPDGVLAPGEATAAVAQQPVERMRALARRIWDEASPVQAGDAVDRYLSGRGLGLDAYPLALRCHPKLGYYERGQGGKSQRVAEFPAMVARIDGPDGELISLHRTYLDGGRRAALPDAKKVLSTGIQGAAIRLFSCSDTLAVAEGIETALAVQLLKAVPVWAALSAGNLERLWVPPHVRRVLICGDNDADAGFDGEASAYALARRLRKEASHGPEREVQVLVPRKPGADWADVWWSVVRHVKRAA